MHGKMFSRTLIGAALAAVSLHSIAQPYPSRPVRMLIPFTPGGLGFVEAGLIGMLTLAGVSAGAAAVATLAYRLVAFWLPIPAGGVAWLLFRRRYP